MPFPPHTWTYEQLTSTLLSLLEWRGKPKAQIAYTTTQSIPNNTITALSSAYTTAYDTDSMVDATNKRLKVTSPGWYVAVAHAVFAADSTGPRKVYLRRNGAAVNVVYVEPDESIPCQLQVTCGPILCAAGDYFNVAVWQNSGGALSTYNGAEGVSSLSLYMVYSAAS